MKLIRIAALAIGACTASAASAQSIEDKRCIFEAASQLPHIPDLKITSSSAKPVDKSQAIADAVARLSSTQQAQELASRFGVLDASLMDDIKLGFRMTYSKQLAVSLVETVSKASSVEIEIQAAAQKATFAFTCLSGAGAVSTSFDGLVR